MMLLFHSDNPDEKFDPVTALMTFINAKANVNKLNSFNRSALFYACHMGSTISSLTLLNKGAKLDQEDIHGNSPFSTALLNNHEDLCIFLIQGNQKTNVSVTEYVETKEYKNQNKDSNFNYVMKRELYEQLLENERVEDMTEQEKVVKGTG